MKRFLLTLCVTLVTLSVCSAQDRAALYTRMNLDLPGLESVKKAYEKGNIEVADKELLKYFRNRKAITLADLDLEDVKINKDEQRWADESLEHKFYAHKGYQPSYFYGEDINWRYWPVQDNELRWQLHRHYWFIPLTKAYYLTRDPKYVFAWIEQYTDWVKKNPLTDISALKVSGASAETIAAEKENVRFAWRPMETSRRMQDQLTEFCLTIKAPQFTPEYLNLFLQMYFLHADYIIHHYSEKGNHLLFEAQRMLYAGIFFPEFKDATAWRNSAIEILNREIGVQVYADGVQFELDYGYHLATIDIFLKALRMAQANGCANEFPASYIASVGKMTEFAYDMLFPDYTNPMFGDTKQHSKSSLRRQFNSWFQLFPDRTALQGFASEGRKGTLPNYTSKMFPEGGYYILRSGWGMDATVAIVKAGPPAFWHNQPDNGTFSFWQAGRDFFPDSGSYVYAGNEAVTAERNWFRQTRVHNTLTLDNKNIETTDSKRRLWTVTDSLVTLVTENQSYKELKHRRSFFFVENQLLVIADEVTGAATGTVGVHFNLCPAQTAFDRDGTFRTLFTDGNNIRIKTASSAKSQIMMEEGWVSTAYRKKEERPAYAVQVQKEQSEGLIFITVIAPDNNTYKGSIAIVPEDTQFDDTLRFSIRVGAHTYHLGYNLK
ncbi:MAG: heparinase II/III family protein [Alistipes sp.]